MEGAISEFVHGRSYRVLAPLSENSLRVIDRCWPVSACCDWPLWVTHVPAPDLLPIGFLVIDPPVRHAYTLNPCSGVRCLRAGHPAAADFTDATRSTDASQRLNARPGAAPRATFPGSLKKAARAFSLTWLRSLQIVQHLLADFQG